MAATGGYASYLELLDTGLFSTEANCASYLYDVGILPQERQCQSCSQPMNLRACLADLYREGCCWSCCGRTVGVRVGSILHNKNITSRQFIGILAEFSKGSTIVLCSGHQRNIVELQNNKEKKKKKAELLIARITELVNTGVPLRDAQAFFRIDAAHYKKLQDRASS